MRRPGVAFIILGGTQFVMVLTMSMLSSTLTSIQQELGTSTGTLSLLTAAYGMSFAGFLLLAGGLVDSGGARRILGAALLVFILGSVVGLLSPSTQVLLIARFLQGSGAAFAVPAALSLVRVVYRTEDDQTRAMAIWGVLSGLGGIAGILYGGFVGQTLSWRWTFVFPALAALIAVVLLVRVIPKGPGLRGSGMDYIAAGAATLALGAASYGLVTGPELSWRAPQVLMALGIGLVAAILFAISERRHSNPLVPGSLLRSWHRRFALLTVFLASTSITTVYFMLAIYFQQILGWSEIATAVGFVPVGIVLFGFSAITGRLLRLVRPLWALALGAAVAGVGLWAIGFAMSTATYGALLPGLVILPIGVAIMFASSTAVAMTDLDDRTAGRAGGLLNAVMEAGPTLGLAILVSIAAAIAQSHSPNPAAIETVRGFTFALQGGGYVYAAIAILLAFGAHLVGSQTTKPHERIGRGS